MTRTRFHQSLGDLKEKLLVMAGLAEQSIERSVEAYRTRDLALVQQVIRIEGEINRYEREIDQMALDLLAMEQPMAIDLRFILAVIKINADVERMGDAAKTITGRVKELQAFSPVDVPVDIPRMASLAIEMVRRALQSFVDADPEAAQAVLALDDAVDKLNTSAYYSLLTMMREQPQYTPQALNAIVVSRSLERVADHATNIAEDVIFWVRGADVRHHLALPPLDGKGSSAGTPGA
jgi:phosphate transport system protein